MVWPRSGLGLGLVLVSSLSSLVWSWCGLGLRVVLCWSWCGLGLVLVLVWSWSSSGLGVVLVLVWSWSWLGLDFPPLAVFGVVRALPAWIQVPCALVPSCFGPTDPLLKEHHLLLVS